MNNKKLISLTICWILLAVSGLCVLLFANNKSAIDTEAEQHFEKANELRKVADHDAAIAEYKKAITLSPNSKIAQDAQYWIGQSHFEAGQFDAALSVFQKLLDEYPASTIIASTKLMIERVQTAKNTKLLFEAIEKGDVNEVRMLIANGANVNAAGDEQWTPLLAAAGEGHAQVVKVLLENGAKVDVGDSYGFTPLFYAIWSDDAETVQALVVSGADVNKTLSGDYSPLVYAIWQEHKNSVETLLNAGADINTKDSEGHTTLYWAAFSSGKDVFDLILAKKDWPDTIYLAACKGDLERVKTLIEGGIDVNAKDEFGCTPLHWAALADSPAVADFLLARGAEVNAQNPQGGMTPLMSAHALPVVESLISKGADIHAKEFPGRGTKLHRACRQGEKEVVDLLIRKGADVNLKGRGGRTPLWFAAMGGHNDVIELLIAKGADINVTDNRGLAPIDVAKKLKQTAVVNVLRQHGAKDTLQGVMATDNVDEVKSFLSDTTDINAKNNQGQTPLHLAARSGAEDVAAWLIEKGADVNIKNNAGKTPLHLAAQQGSKEVAALLIEKGADVHSIDNGGLTPMHLAARRGKAEVVALLIEKGADVLAKEAYHGHRRMPIHNAAARGLLGVIKVLIEKGKVQVNQTDSAGLTAFHHAATANKINVAKYFLDTYPDIIASELDNVLIDTAKGGHTEMVELLLARGARITATQTGKTALNWTMDRNKPDMVRFLLSKSFETLPLNEAAFFGDLEKVKSLLAQGVDINAQDVSGYTALECAVCGVQREVIDYLLSQKADVNIKDARGGSALFSATYHRTQQLDIVKRLIAAGAKVDIKTNSGITPLFWAARNGHVEIIKVLLENGADVNAKHGGVNMGMPLDGDWKPLHVACRGGHLAAVKLLITKGADINAGYGKGKTPLTAAKEWGRRRVVEELRKLGAKE